MQQLTEQKGHNKRDGQLSLTQAGLKPVSFQPTHVQYMMMLSNKR